MLQLKAKELADNPEFNASLGWYQNWKRRHSVSMRTKTTRTQRLLLCHTFITVFESLKKFSPENSRL